VLTVTSASHAAGVCHDKVLRGRALSSSATAASRSASWLRRLVPFGKYWRSSPLVFSLLGRCHGLAFSQKYTGMPNAAAISA
jgi:hypothetical protein